MTPIRRYKASTRRSAQIRPGAQDTAWLHNSPGQPHSRHVRHDLGDEPDNEPDRIGLLLGWCQSVLTLTELGVRTRYGDGPALAVQAATILVTLLAQAFQNR
jgi:hypothetical protein